MKVEFCNYTVLLHQNALKNEAKKHSKSLFLLKLRLFKGLFKFYL